MHDINLAFNQFSSDFAEAIRVRFSKPALNDDILSFRVAKLAQSCQQSVESCATCVGTFGGARRQDSYPRYIGYLLSTGGERPRRYRTTQNAEKFPPPHVALGFSYCT